MPTSFARRRGVSAVRKGVTFRFQKQATANATSITTNFSGSTLPRVGDVLVCVIGKQTPGEAPGSPGTGFVEQEIKAGTNQVLSVWTKVSDGTETSVTSSWASTARACMHTYCYSGLVNGTKDVSNNNDGGAGTVTTLASGTTGDTAQDVELVIAAFCVGALSSAPSYTNGFAELQSTNLVSVALMTASRLTTAHAAQDTTVTYTTAGTVSGLIAAFKAA